MSFEWRTAGSRSRGRHSLVSASSDGERVRITAARGTKQPPVKEAYHARETFPDGPCRAKRPVERRIRLHSPNSIIASESTFDNLDLSSLSKYPSILLVLDTGDRPEAAGAQVEQFKEHIPSGRVAVLSDRCEMVNMIPAFRAGANVHFARNVGCGAFVKALELVMLGQTILPPELLTFVGDRDMGHRPIVHEPAGLPPAAPSTAINDTPRLSFREKSVLRYIVEGSSNKCIARKINIAEATVKVHVKSVLRKIGVQNRTQAAIWAMNNSSVVGSSAVRLGMRAPATAPAVESHEVRIQSPQLLSPIDADEPS